MVRPCHGLELWDVVTLDSPPWGGPAGFVGRVQRYREEWNQDGRWFQVIGLGAVPGKDPGTQPAKRKRRSVRQPPSEPVEMPGTIPIGGIIAWSGAEEDIPADWALCDGNNGTPDLRDRFLVGAGTGSGYNVGDTGGEDASDLAHTHGVGTLATDSDEHSHGAGTLATDNDYHTHGSGTLQTGVEIELASSGYTDQSVSLQTHRHNVVSGSTGGDTHSHSVVVG